MKDSIVFERHVQSSTFHNPMLGNQLDTQTILKLLRNELILTTPDTLATQMRSVLQG